MKSPTTTASGDIILRAVCLKVHCAARVATPGRMRHAQAIKNKELTFLLSFCLESINQAPGLSQSVVRINLRRNCLLLLSSFYRLFLGLFFFLLFFCEYFLFWFLFSPSISPSKKPHIGNGLSGQSRPRDPSLLTKRTLLLPPVLLQGGLPRRWGSPTRTCTGPSPPRGC